MCMPLRWPRPPDQAPSPFFMTLQTWNGWSRSERTSLQTYRTNARTFDVHATPLATASGPGAIAILHDTTDLERLEQIRKDFVANVSHELRTPLAGIIGYADTLLDGALGDAENNLKFIEVIRTNAMRLASLASDLLVLRSEERR